MSDKIELLEQQYVSLIAQNSDNTEQSDISKLIALAAESRPSIADNWQKIEQLVKICTDQNQVNGIILQSSKRNVESRLAILHGQSQTPDAYARNGQTTHYTNSKSIAQV